MSATNQHPVPEITVSINLSVPPDVYHIESMITVGEDSNELADVHKVESKYRAAIY